MNVGLIAALVLVGMVVIGALLDPEARTVLTGRQIKFHERAPWWAGFAWAPDDRNEYVYMIVPLNWVAGFCRHEWQRLRAAMCWHHVYGERDVQEAGRDGYRRGLAHGLESGRRDGYQQAINDIRAEMEKQHK